MKRIVGNLVSSIDNAKHRGALFEAMLGALQMMAMACFAILSPLCFIVKFRIYMIASLMSAMILLFVIASKSKAKAVIDKESPVFRFITYTMSWLSPIGLLVVILALAKDDSPDIMGLAATYFVSSVFLSYAFAGR